MKSHFIQDAFSQAFPDMRCEAELSNFMDRLHSAFSKTLHSLQNFAALYKGDFGTVPSTNQLLSGDERMIVTEKKKDPGEDRLFGNSTE